MAPVAIGAPVHGPTLMIKRLQDTEQRQGAAERAAGMLGLRDIIIGMPAGDAAMCVCVCEVARFNAKQHGSSDQLLTRGRLCNISCSLVVWHAQLSGLYGLAGEHTTMLLPYTVAYTCVNRPPCCRWAAGGTHSHYSATCYSEQHQIKPCPVLEHPPAYRAPVLPAELLFRVSSD